MQHPPLATFCIRVVHILLVQLLDFFLLDFFKLLYVAIYAFDQFIKVGIRTFYDEYNIGKKTLVINSKGSLLMRGGRRGGGACIA